MNTSPVTVEIPRFLVNQLLHHAQSADGKEICGLISSKEGQPVRVYPVRNIASIPQCRYQMDPAEQIDALRRIREKGEELFAIYHSHPASPARPSAIDIAEAGYPEALYLIISLSTKGVLEMRGYRINANNVSEITLAI